MMQNELNLMKYLILLQYQIASDSLCQLDQSFHVKLHYSE